MKSMCFLSAAVLCALSGVAAAGPNKQVIVLDDFEKPGGYTLADYSAHWVNPYGLGELAPEAHGDTRSFTGGKCSISADPFLTAYDFSVFDHIKYLAVSAQSYAVPAKGSLMISVDIKADVHGTIPGRITEGTYIQSGAPYAEPTLKGQQAAATLHLIDFYTGQLFDWFVTDDKAFVLTERLPSSVTGSPLEAGIDKMYTQVIEEFTITPGPHNYAIRYSKKEKNDEVEFLIDSKVVTSKITNIGVPLDVQGKDIITYPSEGPGEPLKDKITSFSIGHGLFSLLDAFPFQHPDAPQLAVSVPVENRIFGQGASATWDNFVVTIEGK